MKVRDIIEKKIDELTDFNVDSIQDNTKIIDIGLVSLDYVAIQVALRKECEIEIDLDKLTEMNLDTYGELIDYIEKNKI